MTAFKEGSIDRWMHARMLGGMPVWELSCYASSPIPPEALRMKADGRHCDYLSELSEICLSLIQIN